MNAAGRVLFVLDHFYPYVGGSETLFRELALGLVGRGWQVTVLTVREPGTLREEVLDGVRIVRVPTLPFARRYWFILFSLFPAIRLAAQVDIVHAAGYASIWAGWLAGWWRRRPKVLTVLEVFADQWRALQDVSPLAGHAFRLYEWLTLRLPFDRYLCISGFTRERLTRFTRIPTARTNVVYAAVDYSLWRPGAHAPRSLKANLKLAESTFLYLCFGRPGVSKGVGFLVEAAKRVRERWPDSHLVLILSPEPERGYRRLVRQISALELDTYVTLLKPVPRDELPSYLLAADCVVVPSFSEGFGYAAVEAASLGCRLIATRGHAVEEVLGEYGTFVAAGDATSLADALVAVARAPASVTPLPAQYTVDRLVEDTLAVYRRVLETSDHPETNT